MAKAERQYGVVEAWAKDAQINAANYSQRAEAHCALKSKDRGGVHPIITFGSPGFLEWLEYFHFLGRVPVTLQRIIDNPNAGHAFTVPEEYPHWFDTRFNPTKGWRPPVSPRPFMRSSHQMSLANVLVRKENARYREMIDRAKTGDPVEFQHDEHGIWVAEKWLG